MCLTQRLNEIQIRVRCVLSWNLLNCLRTVWTCLRFARCANSLISRELQIVKILNFSYITDPFNQRCLLFTFSVLASLTPQPKHKWMPEPRNQVNDPQCNIVHEQIFLFVIKRENVLKTKSCSGSKSSFYNDFDKCFK